MTKKPIKLVMVRRGTITISNVPTQKLYTFIRQKALLATDEISGDGKNWVRIDRHFQLGKFFSYKENEANVLNSNNDLCDEVQFSKPTTDLENDFKEVANLLRDINQ